jgi:hypothetical protein
MLSSFSEKIFFLFCDKNIFSPLWVRINSHAQNPKTNNVSTSNRLEPRNKTKSELKQKTTLFGESQPFPFVEQNPNFARTWN